MMYPPTCYSFFIVCMQAALLSTVSIFIYTNRTVSSIFTDPSFPYQRQCSLHSIGSIPSSPSSSCGQDSSTCNTSCFPFGHVTFNEAKIPFSNVPVAVALAQSSQYHHLLFGLVHGGRCKTCRYTTFTDLSLHLQA